jgi:hypothetical protein
MINNQKSDTKYIDQVVNRYKTESNAAVRTFKNDPNNAATITLNLSDIKHMAIISALETKCNLDNSDISRSFMEILNINLALSIFGNVSLNQPEIENMSYEAASSAYTAYIQNIVENSPEKIKDIVDDLVEIKSTDAIKIANEHLVKAEMWDKLLFAIDMTGDIKRLEVFTTAFKQKWPYEIAANSSINNPLENIRNHIMEKLKNYESINKFVILSTKTEK